MEIRQQSISPELTEALQKQRLSYSSARTLYYSVCPDFRDLLVGVFGDGGNGAYEWFIWDELQQTLRTSDVGYGCIGVALCCGLVEAGTTLSAGDHDEILTWKKAPRG